MDPLTFVTNVTSTALGLDRSVVDLTREVRKLCVTARQAHDAAAAFHNTFHHQQEDLVQQVALQRAGAADSGSAALDAVESLADELRTERSDVKQHMEEQRLLLASSVEHLSDLEARVLEATAVSGADVAGLDAVVRQQGAAAMQAQLGAAEFQNKVLAKQEGLAQQVAQMQHAGVAVVQGLADEQAAVGKKLEGVTQGLKSLEEAVANQSRDAARHDDALAVLRALQEEVKDERRKLEVEQSGRMVAEAEAGRMRKEAEKASKEVEEMRGKLAVAEAEVGRMREEEVERPKTEAEKKQQQQAETEATGKIKASREPGEIVRLMTEHLGAAGVQQAGCEALHIFTADRDNAESRSKVVGVRGIEAVLAGMRKHAGAAGVQAARIGALHHLARDADNRVNPKLPKT
ncbi:hypothetical protein T484DRAFT_1847758 [Baffinella frigidus]|nr:hypothetical protein T484DRAFT_1847758 [Cryptophyta sp. CCMP2293]